LSTANLCPKDEEERAEERKEKEKEERKVEG